MFRIKKLTKYANMDTKICLCCLKKYKTEDLKYLFNFYWREMVLSEVFELVTRYKIKTEDPSSKHICNECFEQLTDAYNFISKCQVSWIHFQKVSFQQNNHLQAEMKCEPDLSDEDSKNSPISPLIEPQGELITAKAEQEEIKTSHRCAKCKKIFLNQKTLERHQIRLHRANVKHKCPICEKEYQFASFLAEHMKNHTGEKPHLCSICGRGFRQSGSLTYHIRTHTGAKPYKCQYCDNTFASHGILKIHIRRHTDERPYVCDYCGQAFRQNTDMQTHKRTQHTKYKPLSCSYCDKKWTTSGALRIHLRVHTGEKPYHCETCKKSFVTRSMLQRHGVVHTGDRPFKCKVCSRGFSQSSSVTKHMATHRVGDRT